MSGPTETAEAAAKPEHGAVLVVDDEPATRMLVAHWLSSAGLRTLQASSGEEALAVLDAAPETIDAILLDVMMPGTDGFEVLRRIKGDPRSRRIPIVFLSAAAAESDVIRGVQAGAVDYLHKPFSGPILVTKVLAIVERGRVERALEHRLRSAEENATLDMLSGLSNRRGFEERLAEMVANSVRHKEPLALLLVDIDRFKAINDELGHPVGDEAIKHLAGKLREVIRAGDQAFRYGGEEFLLLLHKCDRTGATSIFARLRESLQQAPLALEDGRAVPLSVSGGIATMEPDNGFRLVNLVGRADTALYQAKRGGRDRVCIEQRGTPAEGVPRVG